MIGEGGKQHYVLTNDFNRFMCDHSLHRRRKDFCRYCFYAFITEKRVRHNIEDCFKINGKKAIKMPKKGGYVKL